MRDNHFEGQGKFVAENGFSYQGEWKESLMHGQGERTKTDGT